MRAAKSKKEATNNARKNASKEQRKVAQLSHIPFEIKALHKKALLKLLHCHHSGINLTYSDLSLEIGVGEKTKTWQCEAWRHLKKGGFIVSGSEQKTFVLSQKGRDLAMCFVSDEELAEFKTAVTNDELHDKIRKKLVKDLHKGQKHKGKQIFDVLLKQREKHAASFADVSLTRFELAFRLGTNPDSYAFFYGFNALKKMGLVSVTGKLSKEMFMRKVDCLLGNSSDEKKDEDDESKNTDTTAADEEEEEDKEQPGDVVVMKKEPRERVKKESGEELQRDNTEIPKRKKRETTNKIRGGLHLYKLSDKAFLVKVPRQEEN